MVQAKRSPGKWSAWVFALIVASQLWAAHAVVFFAHEYSHSFVAWILGWKVNPLALNYAHLSPTVVLIQLGIDQNVDEVPIFNSGHGAQAAIISAAGMIIGNLLLTLPLGLWGLRIAKEHSSRLFGMLCYWVTVASIGNLIDYVPIRTFTDGTDLYQDMYAVERGLNWTPWTLLTVFGVPIMAVVAFFLFRIMPNAIRWLFPSSPNGRRTMAFLTAFFLFGFYGLAGLLGGGPISYLLSIISVAIIMPIAAILGGHFLGSRGPKGEMAL